MGALSAAFAVIYNLDKQKEIEFEKVRKAVVSEAIQAGFDALNQYEIFQLASAQIKIFHEKFFKRFFIFLSL